MGEKEGQGSKSREGKNKYGTDRPGDDKEWLFVGGRGTDKRGRKEEEGEEMEKRWRRRERWKRDGREMEEMRLKKERRKEGRKDEERRK